ncbi:methanethiol S-methyltransferase [Pseudomonas simiae]|uniref:methanethiol S-methyltransferase n=1 Tax=Pseudomonas simiae TaxID=321846 RepID=UPI0027341A8D|nr:methanethiol S-methyltransferase [Pseudomonas simiae]WLG71618.1 isoprenylcysteine carboxylmethyltransferase family protein [Pseudomonas simiae]
MNPQTHADSLPARLVGLVYSIACYVVFLVTFLYLMGFLGSVVVPKNINAGRLIDWSLATLINGLLIILFGLQHSVMARKRFKSRLTALIPTAAERSTYVLFSSLVLGVMFWLWHPITYQVWHIETAWARALITGLFWTGWAIVLLATLLISHFELFGLKQAIDRWRDTAQHAPVFRTPLLYKIIRHPLYLGFLIAFWATPDMTVGHLQFAMGLTVYLFIGTYFEEKDLTVLFGDRYREYQREVSMIFPMPKRRSK